MKSASLCVRDTVDDGIVLHFCCPSLFILKAAILVKLACLWPLPPKQLALCLHHEHLNVILGGRKNKRIQSARCELFTIYPAVQMLKPQAFSYSDLGIFSL